MSMHGLVDACMQLMYGKNTLVLVSRTMGTHLHHIYTFSVPPSPFQNTKKQSPIIGFHLIQMCFVICDSRLRNMGV